MFLIANGYLYIDILYPVIAAATNFVQQTKRSLLVHALMR
jgi:hypothetical protein